MTIIRYQNTRTTPTACSDTGGRTNAAITASDRTSDEVGHICIGHNGGATTAARASSTTDASGYRAAFIGQVSRRSTGQHNRRTAAAARTAPGSPGATCDGRTTPGQDQIPICQHAGAAAAAASVQVVWRPRTTVPSGNRCTVERQRCTTAHNYPGATTGSAGIVSTRSSGDTGSDRL